MLKKILLSPWTALLTLVLVVGIRVADPTFVENVRLKYFDELITSKAPTENNIYTVNIDEDTITKYGQYPFPRDVYAKIIEDLYKRNAGLVVFNVLLSEPDRFGKDHVLAETMNKFPVILPNTPENKNKNTPRNPSTAVIKNEYANQITQYAGILANIPTLESRAAGTGTIHTDPENDNVVRRMPLVIAVDGVVYPSIAMEALRVAAGDSTTQIKLNENGVEKMRIPKFGPITTDDKGRVWIDWSQQSKSVSAADLPKDFAGAVVIVGVAATGLGNPVPTPVQGTWPQDVQAAVLGTMFNGVTIQRPDYADGAEILALIGFGLLLIFLSRWTYVGICATVVIVGAVVPGTMYAFTNWLILSDATAISFGLILVALHTYGVKFVSEFLQKQAIKKQFAGYCSKEVV